MDKEIKYLLEEIKDNTYDYVGTNGCLYQDLSREELNLLLKYISNLQNQVQRQKEVIDKVKEYIWRTEINSIGTPLAYVTIGKELLDILKEVSE